MNRQAKEALKRAVARQNREADLRAEASTELERAQAIAVALEQALAHAIQTIRRAQALLITRQEDEVAGVLTAGLDNLTRL